MGEAEDIYRDSVERLDEEFLEKIKKTKDLPGLEKEYLKKLNILKEKYVCDSYRFLKNQKSKTSLNTSLLDDKNFKKFKSSRESLDFSESEKKSIEREIKKFRFKRKIRDYFFRKTPSRLIYFYYLSNQKLLRYKEGTLDYFNNFKTESIEFISDSFSGIQNFLKKSLKFMLAKFTLIYSLVKGKLLLFTRTKKEEKGEVASDTSPVVAAGQEPSPEKKSLEDSSDQKSLEKAN